MRQEMMGLGDAVASAGPYANNSAPCSRQITTPTHRHSVFLQVGCSSCRPTNSIKALKALKMQTKENCFFSA